MHGAPRRWPAAEGQPGGRRGRTTAALLAPAIDRRACLQVHPMRVSPPQPATAHIAHFKPPSLYFKLLTPALGRQRWFAAETTATRAGIIQGGDRHCLGAPGAPGTPRQVVDLQDCALGDAARITRSGKAQAVGLDGGELADLPAPPSDLRNPACAPHPRRSGGYPPPVTFRALTASTHGAGGSAKPLDATIRLSAGNCEPSGRRARRFPQRKCTQTTKFGNRNPFGHGKMRPAKT